jgi:hypothetical protein
MARQMMIRLDEGTPNPTPVKCQFCDTIHLDIAPSIVAYDGAPTGDEQGLCRSHAAQDPVGKVWLQLLNRTGEQPPLPPPPPGRWRLRAGDAAPEYIWGGKRFDTGGILERATLANHALGWMDALDAGTLMGVFVDDAMTGLRVTREELEAIAAQENG